MNDKLSHGIAIAIQVTFIFAFLTLFFFAYVQEIEKEEFRTQLNLIVDNISEELSKELPDLLNKQSVLKPEDIAIILDGIISVVQAKVAIQSKTATSEIAEKNQKIKTSALKSLIMVIGIVVIAAIIMLILGFCVSLLEHVREAMLVVIFIGLTELAFLQIIAKNYITADPNRVKRALAQSIQNWIAKRTKN